MFYLMAWAFMFTIFEIFSYLCSAFLTWDFMIHNWEAVRAVTFIIFVLTSVIVLGEFYNDLDKIEKQKEKEFP